MWKVLKRKNVALFMLAMTLSLICISTANSETRYPAVGEVVGKDSLGFSRYCAGTLIGKRTVLTDTHCFDHGTPYVVIGGEVYSGVGYIDRNSGVNHGYSLAVLDLDRDVVGIEPMPLCQAPSNLVNLGVMVFYSEEGYGVDVTKVTKFYNITHDYPKTFWIERDKDGGIVFENGANSLYPINGGPALMKANTTECVMGVNIAPLGYYRLDNHMTNWINGFRDPVQWVAPTPCSKVCWMEDEDELWGGGVEKCRMACNYSCEQYRDQPEDDWEVRCQWK